jgi:Glycosyl transferase family 11
VSGKEKLRLLYFSERIPEQLIDNRQQPQCSGPEKPTVITFRGTRDFFCSVRATPNIIGKELREMARPIHLPTGSRNLARAIGVHVRLGDFINRPDPMQSELGRANTKVPLQWYVKQLSKLREAVGSDLPAVISSDGTDGELAEILRLTNTRRLPKGSALADLLSLSTASFLIASGSTFSMWAAYLGDMPVVWPKGQMRQPLQSGGLEVDLWPDERLPVAFRDRLHFGSR